MIDLKYIKKSKYHNKKLVSMSLFKIFGGGYRPFAKYVNNLILVLSFIKNNLPDYDINLYIDSNVLDDTDFKTVLDSENYNNLNIIVYECKMFKVNEKYHDGIFGTFVRFLPIFDKQYEIVYVRDVDLPETFFRKLEEDYLIKYDAQIFINSFLFYDKPWSDVNFPILAGLFDSRYTYDIQILYNFLNDVKDNKYKDIVEEINAHYKKINARITNAKFFPFGMDEYFLNHILRNQFKVNKFKVIVNIFMNIGQFIKNVNYNDKIFTQKDAIQMSNIEEKVWYGDMKSLNMMMRKSNVHFDIIIQKGLYIKYKKVIDKYKEFSKLIDYNSGMAYKVFDFTIQ